ncbi:hypothetical protein EUGRSUZ_F04333 [Eucalyptus grandis]|uniref:Uncharacterized protein n=2 Tax=Eucalyptus grandis TaxID=71139 RepID=A0ACC3KQG8_EUCGR|nr:hypothetical protein EUGRSUZ_F04333 [Eucalyptus grandis]
MAVDESFKKPGAIPFKWEIRPGVPKIQHHRHRQLPPPPRPLPEDPPHRDGHSSLPKLKPPPAAPGPQFLSPLEMRTGSFRSAPRTRSERWRLGPPMLGQPECVSSGPGCFPAAPLLKRKESKRRSRRTRPEPEPELDSCSDLGTPSRFSFSTQRSLSPYRESPCASSYLSVMSSPRLSFSSYIRSHQSSPRCMGDPEWAGFGLF